jgi:hypothetical protein
MEINIHSIKGLRLGKIRKLSYSYHRELVLKLDKDELKLVLYADKKEDLEL